MSVSFTLHKFRRTYITALLRNGIDLRTVQVYAGHKDIASTMRYQRPASAKEAQAKLNSVAVCHFVINEYLTILPRRC